MKTHEIDVIEDTDTGQRAVSLTPVRKLKLLEVNGSRWHIELDGELVHVIGTLATVQDEFTNNIDLFLHLDEGWFYSIEYDEEFTYLCPVCTLEAAKKTLFEQTQGE